MDAGKITTHLSLLKRTLDSVQICPLVLQMFPFCITYYFLAVPLEFIEKAAKELRVYLMDKKSPVLCVMNHLDTYYIYGKHDDIFITSC